MRFCAHSLDFSYAFPSSILQIIKGDRIGGGVGSNGGEGRKKLRTIRLCAKPTPPWGNLAPNPRNMATAENIIPANNMVANYER